MKKLQVLFVALVLILGSFEANAKRVFLHERQLLSDAGKKVTAGPSDQKASQNPEANNVNNGAAAAAQAGAVNKNYDNVYGGQDGRPDSHRYFRCEQLPSVHCR